VSTTEETGERSRIVGLQERRLGGTVVRTYQAVVEKVARKRISNSKNLRKLPVILPDPVASENFLSEEGDLETASLRVRHGLAKKNAAYIASWAPL
jgi:ParB family chromosome partitioning protein